MNKFIKDFPKCKIKTINKYTANWKEIENFARHHNFIIFFDDKKDYLDFVRNSCFREIGFRKYKMKKDSTYEDLWEINKEKTCVVRYGHEFKDYILTVFILTENIDKLNKQYEGIAFKYEGFTKKEELKYFLNNIEKELGELRERRGTILKRKQEIIEELKLLESEEE